MSTARIRNTLTSTGWLNRFVVGVKDIKNILRPHLFFETGVFAGRNIILKSDIISLGASDESNVVFVDPNFPDHAVNLDFSDTGFGISANVSTLNEAILVNGRTKIPPNTSFTCRLPIRIAIDNITFKIGYKIPKPKNLQDGLSSLVIAGIGTIVVHLFLSNFMPWLSISQQSTATMIMPGAYKVEKKSDFFLGKQTTIIVDRKIKEAGFSKYVKFFRLGENNFRLDGIIPESRRQEWSDFERWIDGSTPGIFIQRNVSLEDLNQINNHIGGIVESDDVIWVVNKNGELLRLGDEVWNGWKITNISSQDIQFEKYGIIWTVIL